VRQFDQTVQIVLQTGYASEKPARQMLQELDIQGYHDKSEGPEKLLIWVDAALKTYRQVRALNASREGLQHILKVAPDIHRIQPIHDLVHGVLIQLEGLLGLSGTFVATASEPGGSFLATIDNWQFRVEAATGHYRGKHWESLSEAERLLVNQAAESAQIQLGQKMALPLIAGERVMGVVVVEQATQPQAELELLSIFATQAAIAIENVRLYELATRDDLTRLFNRRHWMYRLDDCLRLAQRHGQPTSVLLLDVDHFKKINDRHGHLVGDRVLAALGKKLNEKLRKTDLAGRYGGEEFAVVLPLTDQEGAKIIAERVREGASEVVVLDEGNHVPITVSIGVATLTVNSPVSFHFSDDQLFDIRQNILQSADEALYRAKNQGRNRVVADEVLLFEPLTELESA
jgi:diguanylate cyclase (GGDEF)-like protein